MVNKLERRFEYYDSWLQESRNEFDYGYMIRFFVRFVEWQCKQEGIAQQSGIKSTLGWAWISPNPKQKEVGKLNDS